MPEIAMELINRSRPNYKKLVVFSQLIQSDSRVLYMIANPKKKRFGSAALWEMCSNVQRDLSSTVSSTSFSKMFALKAQPTLDNVP